MEYADLSKEELIKLLQEQENKIKLLEQKCEAAVKEHDFETPNICNADNIRPVLNTDAIKRYSRQLILPEIGPKGQKLLFSASVLIVGCGGLGCPASIYLSAAGIGKLGLLDFDEIEISNLHRQILHSEKKIGVSKVHSIAKAVKDLNSKVICIPYFVAANSENIMNIISNYDVILDCTDNVATRYLLNDACVFSHKPLVSGSALRFEGQMTVYAYLDGPCYRCLFPNPPPPNTVTNCSDGGVLGAVPGVIGCLQAIEAIKIIAKFGNVCFKKMILFDASSMSFRNINLRNKQSHCDICSDSPTIQALVDYEQFCGMGATDKGENVMLLCDKKRITVKEYKVLLDNHKPHLLIDVRSPVELDICSLPDCINIPISEIGNHGTKTIIEKFMMEKLSNQIICICRRGNDSQKAVLALESIFTSIQTPVVDIIGGLHAWSKEIDNSFPIY